MEERRRQKKLKQKNDERKEWKCIKLKNIFFFNMYKMLDISAETYAKNNVHNIIDKEKMVLLINKDIGKN